MAVIDAAIERDVEAIGKIPIVPKLLEVICRTTGMGFAAIARVTEDKWVACSVKDDILFGLESGGELKLETTICHEIRQSGESVVIDHVNEDPFFFTHHTPAMYGFQSYISVPIIRRDGSFFGTLCAIDPRPAKLNTPEITGMFTLFADLISFHLEAIEQLTHAETKLSEERTTAELREQFIAILGHDLRNPLAAVLNVSQMLMRMPLDERVMRLAHIIQDSGYRMKGMIDNIMDFARGRLGGGIVLDRKDDDELEKTLKHAISELQLIWPERIIDKEFAIVETVNCDSKSIAQLFSNLLGNALIHGKPDAPVKIKAVIVDGEFILSVANSGAKIPEASMSRLFQPFSRGEVKPGQQGLGLGLYIASEIAAAHNGKLSVISTDKETVFTLTMQACI